MEIFCCGDDGIAWHASDELERTFSPAEVELLRLHQLTPELAETVGHYEAVIFVNADASGENTNLGPGQVRCEEVRSKSKVVLFEDIVRPVAESCFSHRLSPKAIVTLAHQLYGANSRAFSVTLTGKCLITVKRSHRWPSMHCPPSLRGLRIWSGNCDLHEPFPSDHPLSEAIR
jgi:Ni,Fe-hydrogenase maturation factor